jgi:hypothetical protein
MPAYHGRIHQMRERSKLEREKEGTLLRAGQVRGIETQAQKEIIQAQTAGQSKLLTQQQEAKSQAFERFRSFTAPYLQQLAGVSGGETPGTLTESQEGVISGIQEKGQEAQGELATALSRRGIYGGGVSAAAAAKQAAETESNIFLARAQFEEQAAQRRQQERLARQQAFTSLFQSTAGQLGAY